MLFTPIITEPTSAALNLQGLVVYRYLVLAGQLIAVGAATALDFSLPLPAVLTIIALFAIFNQATVLRLRRHATRVTEQELFLHLLSDVLILTALLHFTGGSTNPFVSLFLVPLTLAAAALPGRYTWAVAAAALCCYSLLMVWYVPLPHQHGDNFTLHVLGMWFGFVLSAVLISYFAVKMNATLRARELALASAREERLRSERLVALGTLAAGAAHALGTPLATMAVLSKELENDCAGLPSAAGQLRILRGEIDRCKRILSSLAVSAGQPQALGGRSQALDVYLAEVVGQWRELRPHVALHQQWQGPQPAPRVVADQTLTHAFTNILNNAADVSPHHVECRGRWSGDYLWLEVCDRGVGISDVVEAHLGEAFFTTKPDGEGMGLGLFLAQATIQRLGGSVQLLNRSGGGACTRIELPLAGVLVRHE